MIFGYLFATTARNARIASQLSMFWAPQTRVKCLALRPHRCMVQPWEVSTEAEKRNKMSCICVLHLFYICFTGLNMIKYDQIVGKRGKRIESPSLVPSTEVPGAKAWHPNRRGRHSSGSLCKRWQPAPAEGPWSAMNYEESVYLNMGYTNGYTMLSPKMIQNDHLNRDHGWSWNINEYNV